MTPKKAILEDGFKRLADVCAATEFYELPTALRTNLQALTERLRRTEALVFAMVAIHEGLRAEKGVTPSGRTFEPSIALVHTGFRLQRAALRHDPAATEIEDFSSWADGAADAVVAACMLGNDAISGKLTTQAD